MHPCSQRNERAAGPLKLAGGGVAQKKEAGTVVATESVLQRMGGRGAWCGDSGMCTTANRCGRRSPGMVGGEEEEEVWVIPEAVADDDGE